MNNDEMIRFHLTDFHPMDRFRVNGVVSNLHEFANAFNCPKNSPMNPENKCSLW